MRIILLSFLAVCLLSSATCNKAANKSTCFKGRLEIKGICSNYTIRLLEGNMDTSLINTAWIDENTGRTYGNVFGLANPCIFDKELKEGDEFYFKVDSTTKADCAVCMAYYPTPPKKLTIKVLPSCN
ncbi:MAG TPA: hypothetical protein VGB46_10605 [Flavisolibacter sp.]|jgi:hypothetical protein